MTRSASYASPEQLLRGVRAGRLESLPPTHASILGCATSTNRPCQRALRSRGARLQHHRRESYRDAGYGAYAKNPIPQIPVSQFQVLGGLLFAGPGNHQLWSQPTTDFLPRVGLAFQVNDKTVIRSGYGIFYDTIGVNRSPIIQSGFTASTPIQASIDNGLHFIASTANPFPNGLLQPQGAAGGYSTFLGQSAQRCTRPIASTALFPALDVRRAAHASRRT